MLPFQFVASSGFIILTFTSSVILAKEEETRNEPAEIKEAGIDTLQQDWLEKEIALADHCVSYDDEGLLDIGIGESIDGKRQVKRFPLTKLEFYFERQNHKEHVVVNFSEELQKTRGIEKAASDLEEFYFSRGYQRILFVLETSGSLKLYKDVVTTRHRSEARTSITNEQEKTSSRGSLQWVAKEKASADHSIFYSSKDQIDILIGAAEKNLRHPQRFSLHELEDYFLNQRHKSFVTVTFAKGLLARDHTNAEIPELERFFFSRGYQRILFIGATGGLVVNFKYSEAAAPTSVSDALMK